MKAPILATLALVAGAMSALAQSDIPVTVDNFIRAESDTYITNFAKESGGLSKLVHRREPASIDKQTVIRLNRDTLYSSAALDLDAGPVTVTMPDPGQRFMSIMAVSQDHYAQTEYGKEYENLEEMERKIVDLKVKHDIKENRYDEATDTLTLSAGQVKALQVLKDHWEATFRDGEKRYGFLPGTVRTAEEREQISRFFFWTAWVASTARPDADHFRRPGCLPARRGTRAGG